MDASHRVLDTPPLAIATATGYMVSAEGLRLCASSRSENKLFAVVQRRT